MFDAHSHGEFLLLHREPARKQHLKGVARAVPHREHERLAFLPLPVRRKKGERAVAQGDIFEPRGKTHLPALRKDMPSDVRDHFFEVVAAHMRLAEVRHFRRRAEADERL